MGNWLNKQISGEIHCAIRDYLGELTVEYWNHYRPHERLGGSMVMPYPQDTDVPRSGVSFLGGLLLHGYRREKLAA